MVIKNICKGLGCDCEFKYIKRFPLTYNDKVLTEKVINILKDSWWKSYSHSNKGIIWYSFSNFKLEWAINLESIIFNNKII